MHSRQCKNCTNLAHGLRKMFCEDCEKLCSKCRKLPRDLTSHSRVARSYCTACGLEREAASYERCADNRAQQRTARNTVNTMIRAGTIKQEVCEVCQSPQTIRFYESYEPLKLRWLCKTHFTEASGVRLKAKNESRREGVTLEQAAARARKEAEARASAASNPPATGGGKRASRRKAAAVG